MGENMDGPYLFWEFKYIVIFINLNTCSNKGGKSLSGFTGKPR